MQIILLDTTFNRGTFQKDPMPKEERLKIGKVGGYIPDDSPEKSHLGEAQWRWLEAELRKPAELRLLCSSTQVIPNQKRMDEWGNFPHGRERLLKMAKKAGNVVILSGNLHFAEVSQTGDGTLTDLSIGFRCRLIRKVVKRPRHPQPGSSGSGVASPSHRS